MRRFRLTDAAGDELESVLDYYGQYSPEYSKKLRRELRNRIRLVTRHPNLGTRADHLAPGIRKISIYDIMIYFRDEMGVTVIHHVLHGARDIDSAFFDESTP